MINCDRKLSEMGYNRSGKKCKEKFENIYKYHRRTKGGRSGRNYRFFDQLEALDNHLFLEQNCSSLPMAVDPVSVVKYDENLLGSSSTSTTSTSSKQRKKRKLSLFCERLMKEVIEKQESLQKKFLDAIDKCEQDRISREEAWKMQELDRIKRERELLDQERSIAAAKDAAVLAFLQKFSDQPGAFQFPETPKSFERQEQNIGVGGVGEGGFVMHMGSSRWPKDEVEALIKLRTNLDTHYQDNGPKGPLWEEISRRMKNLGYDRNAKRCKEKWENMNKYFKKVKESNKRRPEDAKTCPYFHQLNAIYNERNTKKGDTPADNPAYEYKPEELLMHMMSAQPPESTPANADDNQNEEDRENEEDGENEDENEQDDYQLVPAAANNPSSLEIMG